MTEAGAAGGIGGTGTTGGMGAIGVMGVMGVMGSMGGMGVMGSTGGTCMLSGFLPDVIDLQLFAEDGPGGEKTEKATTKKREDARKKGQVMKSTELVSAFELFVAFFALRVLGGLIYERISMFAQDVFSLERSAAADALGATGIYRLYVDSMVTFLICAGPILALVFVAALAANVAQVGFVFSTESIGLKLNRINPVSGFRRLFSGKNAMNLLKSVAKVVVIGGIGYSYVRGQLPDLMALLGAETGLIVKRGFDMVFNLAFRICGAMLALAFFDYAFQWWQYEKDLRMTKHEVKEEFKQMEGDPKVKSKIKEKQRQISMQRMMSEVPKADVVITNPTHYAVAVRYDIAVADAPVVIAKGAGYVARRIREVAEENDVDVVENKPLARALYDGVGIGAKIPQELYQAVAEVLAIVYRKKNKPID